MTAVHIDRKTWVTLSRAKHLPLFIDALHQWAEGSVHPSKSMPEKVLAKAGDLPGVFFPPLTRTLLHARSAEHFTPVPQEDLESLPNDVLEEVLQDTKEAAWRLRNDTHISATLFVFIQALNAARDSHVESSREGSCTL